MIHDIYINCYKTTFVIALNERYLYIKKVSIMYLECI